MTNKTEDLRDLYFEAGAGLYDSQTFEFRLTYLLFILSHQGLISLPYATAEAMLDGKSKRTIGQLLSRLREERVLDAATERQLESALEARNELIHRYFMDNVDRMLFAHERDEMVKEVRLLRRRIQTGLKLIDPIVEQLLPRYGITMKQLTSLVEEAVTKAQKIENKTGTEH